ncbi:MAG: glutamine amidotransferase [Armatimonadota bacterium]
MAKLKVLIAGESWMTTATHYKGWDFFSSTTFHTGVEHLQRALELNGAEVTHMPAHAAAEAFPSTVDRLRAYDIVVLSDLGANTLLLHPETWLHGRAMPNRLAALRDYVQQGGGLAMAGGYYSFSGIYGAAHYHDTPVEAVLPVEIFPYDDRVEVPEGFMPDVVAPEHPILRGVPQAWPALLGYNHLRAKPEATILAVYQQRPILAVRQVARGRTLAWASEVGPHWCPQPCREWDGYGRLWGQAMRWLASQEG